MNTVDASGSSVGAYVYIVYIRIQCSITHILCMNCILCMYKRKKSLCRDHRITTSNYIMRKTPCIYNHFLILVFPHQGGPPGATRGCGGVWHALSGLISIFVVDISSVRSGCIQIGSRSIWLYLLGYSPDQLM